MDFHYQYPAQGYFVCPITENRCAAGSGMTVARIHAAGPFMSGAMPTEPSGCAAYRPATQDGSMETSSMDTSIFVVSPSAGGKWNVVEEGLAKPIAWFDDKDDAIDYATELVKTKPSGRIDIRNGMGSVEAMLQFEGGRPAERV
jgi:hypothetical protein